MLQSRAVMSAHGKKKILVRAVDEKQVISHCSGLIKGENKIKMT